MTTDNPALVSRLRSELGQQFIAALEDPATTDIVANPNGDVWIERSGATLEKIDNLSVTSRLSVINAVAAHHSLTVTWDAPILEATFPIANARFSGAIPPVVSGPAFAIRRPPATIYTLQDYRQAAAITQEHLATLKSAILNRANIMISGGTGSGKTTLANAILADISASFPEARYLTLEDTRELQLAAPDTCSLTTSPHVSLTDLVRASLRFRPDRIIIGEIRGPEALDLLDAWNTGHPGGVTTIHANNPQAALTRLHTLISRNPSAPRQIQPLIDQTIDLVCQIGRNRAGQRVVLELLERRN